MTRDKQVKGYTIELSGAEIGTLDWLEARGYFPKEILNAMVLADGEVEDHEEMPETLQRKWIIPEHAAWSLLTLREDDPDAYLACLGEPLLGKVLALERQIV